MFKITYKMTNPESLEQNVFPFTHVLFLDSNNSLLQQYLATWINDKKLIASSNLTRLPLTASK